MRLVRSLESSSSNVSFATNIAQPQPAEPTADSVGDALASACLCGIVGGLIFAVAIVPALSVIVVGAVLGAGCGIVIAYH